MHEVPIDINIANASYAKRISNEIYFLKWRHMMEPSQTRFKFKLLLYMNMIHAKTLLTLFILFQLPSLSPNSVFSYSPTHTKTQSAQSYCRTYR